MTLIAGELLTTIAEKQSRLLVAARDTHGLSVTVLAAMSLVGPALLARHHPGLGGVSAAVGFTLFALRNNAL